MPQKIHSHIQARGFDRPTIIAQYIGDLIRRHSLASFFDEDKGFLPGVAREEFALWYLSCYASQSQLARPLVREILLLEAFVRARKILEAAFR